MCRETEGPGETTCRSNVPCARNPMAMPSRDGGQPNDPVPGRDRRARGAVPRRSRRTAHAQNPPTHTARFPAQAFGFEFSGCGSMNECVRLYVCFTAVIKSIHANLTRTAYSTEYISMMCMQKVPGRGASCHTLPPFRFRVSVLRLRLRFSVQPAITAIPACSVPCIDPGSGASSNVTSTTSTSSACSAATCIASFILCW